MDLEFEKIKQLLPEMIINVAAAKENVAKVKRKL